MTHPRSDLTLLHSTLLADFVWAAELLHVFTEVTLTAVVRPQTGVALAAHPSRALDLRTQTPH